MSAEDIREFIKEKNPDDYHLIDVRMPEEYESGHIPGARLIPLDTIKDHAKELDPGKPTIAY